MQTAKAWIDDRSTPAEHGPADVGPSRTQEQLSMRPIASALAVSALTLAGTTAAVAGPGPFFGPPGPPLPPRPGPWGGWIAPLVTGTVLGAVIASEPRTVVVETPASSQAANQASETVYKRVSIYIPECRCYRTYDVPID
jgi:hypothetical protein